MNKKYILLFFGAVGLLIIFAGVILIQQQQTSVPATKNQNSAFHQTSERQGSIPTATLAPVATTPKDAVKQFYAYYFSSPTNPLAEGAYKDNPYLSPDFKDMLGSLYNNGNAPVFCLQNKRPNITVGQGTDIYYDNQYLKQEIISDATGSKDLYRVVLQQVNGKWLIYDVTCVS